MKMHFQNKFAKGACAVLSALILSLSVFTSGTMEVNAGNLNPSPPDWAVETAMYLNEVIDVSLSYGGIFLDEEKIDDIRSDFLNDIGIDTVLEDFNAYCISNGLEKTAGNFSLFVTWKADNESSVTDSMLYGIMYVYPRLQEIVTNSDEFKNATSLSTATRNELFNDFMNTLVTFSDNTATISKDLINAFVSLFNNNKEEYAPFIYYTTKTTADLAPSDFPKVENYGQLCNYINSSDGVTCLTYNSSSYSPEIPFYIEWRLYDNTPFDCFFVKEQSGSQYNISFYDANYALITRDFLFFGSYNYTCPQSVDEFPNYSAYTTPNIRTSNYIPFWLPNTGAPANYSFADFYSKEPTRIIIFSSVDDLALYSNGNLPYYLHDRYDSYEPEKVTDYTLRGDIFNGDYRYSHDTISQDVINSTTNSGSFNYGTINDTVNTSGDTYINNYYGDYYDGDNNTGSGSGGSGDGDGGDSSSGSIWDALTGIFSAVVNGISGLVSAVATLITGLLDIVTNLVNIFTTAITDAFSMIGNLLSSFESMSSGFTSMLSAFFPYVPQDIWNVLTMALYLSLLVIIIKMLIK